MHENELYMYKAKQQTEHEKFRAGTHASKKLRTHGQPLTDAQVSEPRTALLNTFQNRMRKSDNMEQKSKSASKLAPMTAMEFITRIMMAMYGSCACVYDVLKTQESNYI
jgi:hypothetical protein